MLFLEVSFAHELGASFLKECKIVENSSKYQGLTNFANFRPASKSWAFYIFQSYEDESNVRENIASFSELLNSFPLSFIIKVITVLPRLVQRKTI